MNKLLILVDVQNDFISGVLGTKEAQEAVPKIVEKLKNWDGDVICTKDTHESDYLNTLEGKNLPVPHCVLGTEGHDINKDVDTRLHNLASKDKLVLTLRKENRFGTLLLPRLIEMYEAGDTLKYDCIEFVGFCTDICVVSNLLIVKAAFPEVEIAVDASCCAGTTPENHQHALEVMKSCQIEILNG